MNRFLALILPILLFHCSSPKPEHQDPQDFLQQWATSFVSRDKTVQRFYDPMFEFPDVIFKDSANLQYSLDVDHLEISNHENEKDIAVVVPFQLTDRDGVIENGKFTLMLSKTDQGFMITDMSQELTIEILWRNRQLAQNQEYRDQRLVYDSIWSQVRKSAQQLSQHYDSVVFFTQVNNQFLFYVVNGDWVYPYPYDSTQYESGNYKMGVVTADNKVIVPVEYSKIYNPGGSFKDLIEVERNGMRGLFTINGRQLVPAEFEGIYPTKASWAIAQLRKGNRYGWVNQAGEISFDKNSHADKNLFQSPIATDAILGWKFVYPGSASVLIDMKGSAEQCDGIIVYPSFLRDLGVTRVAHPWVLNNANELGMGMTDTEIKIERAESLSDKLYGLISFFMESGADARGYHFTQNDLLVLDSNMVKVDHLQKLSVKGDNLDPCTDSRNGPSYRVVKAGLYESNDGNGSYTYYSVNAEGKVEALRTDRTYSFTKFVKINEEYFANCRYESLPHESVDWNDETSPNVVITLGLSTEELDIMRNEIFAEYGLKFKSPKWKAYFEKMPWYNPRFDNVDDQLTEIDKYNIKFILEYQQKFKDRLYKRDSIRYGWAA